ncbi:MAG: SpoIIE family protein phosphatase [Oligoflexia bacterium]|nr:SpoIIE family protein phosphatase [Oligoflexia bacterium]
MGLSIRKKLNALVAGTVLLGVASVIGLATELFTEDIGRLIEKGTADAAEILAGRLRSELRRVAERAQLLAALPLESVGRQQDALRFLQERLSADPDLISLSFWRRAKVGGGLSGTQFSLEWRVLRSGADPGLAALTQARPEDGMLESAARGTVELAPSGPGHEASFIRVAIPLVRAQPGNFSGLLTFDVRREALGAVFAAVTQSAGALLDRQGRILESSDPARLAPGTSWSELAALPELPEETRTEAGIRQLLHRDSQGRSWTIARRSLGFAGLSAVTRAPLDQVIATKEKLYRRSGSLGVAILSLALLIALAFSSALTRPIVSLTHAADRIASGDLSARASASSTDELSRLARSFNSMAARIDGLLAETAEKARMEKELDTARAVQKVFSPLKSFESERFNLAGNMLAASECGGDWWHYSRVGNQLVLVIGDVTGHGVSAALVTAAAHGAYSLLMKRVDPATLRQAPGEWLRELAKDLNAAILATGDGRSVMTFVASVIDLATGNVVSVNAAHRPPYLYRAPADGAKDPQQGYHWLAPPDGQALGEAETPDLQLTSFKLEPGDLLLWYTDGLVERADHHGRPFGKSRLLRLFREIAIAKSLDLSGACERLMKLGESSSPNTPPADDITVVIGRYV